MPEQPRLLIVDDDRKIAKAIGVRLRAAGYDVHNAHDGEEGLACATQLIPNAIILDIRMPKLSGIEVLAKLREQKQTQHIPVIVLSACAVEECKALDAGAYCFLPKPYDPHTLLASIDSALERSSPLTT